MERAVPDSSRADLFVSQLDVVERVIAFVCARHRVSSADAEDFGSYVKLKFVESDYAVLAKFEGRSSLRTYLTVVIQRLFLDYRISAWGKWRPSAEARRAGPVGVLLEQLMVRDGHPFEEACEALRTTHCVDVSRAVLESLAARLPVRLKRRFERDDALADVASNTRPADDAAADRDREATATLVSAALQRLTETLDAQDRLIIAMRFEDGRTVADIATILRLEQKALYRRLDRLLLDLRRALEAEGIDAAAVRDLLDSPAVEVAWTSVPRPETVAPRPSIAKGASRWR
jgi:RNA polymerase sigma factor for flagellar operon FliA